LLPELWKRAKKIGRDDIDKLAKFVRRELKNIKICLQQHIYRTLLVKNKMLILFEIFLDE